MSKRWDMVDSKGNGRLVLTLCKSDARGSYHHAIIPLPESYEDAVNEARQVFQYYIDLQFPSSNIVLKCALKRANGTGAWGILRPTDWMKVIRPDGDEVGVFLSQDALGLPYEPAVESDRAGNQGSEVQQPQPPPPASTSETQMEKRIMYLILKKKPVNKPHKSTMIMVPATYQACQCAAYNAFKADLGYNTKEGDIILRICRGENFYSVVTPEAYSIVLSRSGDSSIDLLVSDKYD